MPLLNINQPTLDSRNDWLQSRGQWDDYTNKEGNKDNMKNITNMVFLDKE